ncbi:unnamed protein product [Paramecium primaurelia]|uniref:Uncharacterized protein n=1 Tax=Paramecium primaurelia TaxID=5886 RepID=A0A8S1NNT0_PARPR|nr:unnamed protein product [Paramecium primaurelia]
MITWNERGYKGFYNAGLNWRYQKTDYIIQQSSNGDLYYIYDGAIQKILPTSTQIKQSDIIRNLDEIQYLSWEGVLLNNNKIGKWSAFWKYENLNIGGYYDEKGIKQGLWKELFKNYWDQSSITLKGEYRDEKARGRWNIYFKDTTFGGGNYDENGLMQGLWVEIDDFFLNKCRVYYVGNYKQGKKSGLWDTKYQEKIVGGGIYNENGQKNGFWIELHENYFNQCYVHYSGKYLKGKKHGQWQIKYKKNTSTFEQLIGGGIFDFDGKKQGQWVELDENFSQQFDITHSGNYFDGKKKGTWRCMMRIDTEITQIGFGVYNKNGLKNGKWMELHENSIFRDPITCIGEYRNGVRIGKWRTFFCNQLTYQMIDQQVGQEFMILMEEKQVNGGFQGKILINIINLLNQVVLRMTRNLDFGKLYLTQGQLLWEKDFIIHMAQKKAIGQIWMRIIIWTNLLLMKEIIQMEGNLEDGIQFLEQSVMIHLQSLVGEIMMIKRQKMANGLI